MLKRIVVFMLSMLLIVPVAYANETEGIFVPNFQAFMSAFVPKVESIHPDFAAKIREQCFVDGRWLEPSTYDHGISYYHIATDMRIRESNGFLYDISIELPKNYIDKKEEDIFKQFILAASTSIIFDADEEFEQAFFDNIHYDYAKESPAGYISLHWHCGVYSFNLVKSSSGLELTISLSLYSSK